MTLNHGSLPCKLFCEPAHCDTKVYLSFKLWREHCANHQLQPSSCSCTSSKTCWHFITYLMVCFISPGMCIHSVLLGFFNCMSHMVLNLKGRDFLALQVWISSSGFRVVSLNKTKFCSPICQIKAKIYPRKICLHSKYN